MIKSIIRTYRNLVKSYYQNIVYDKNLKLGAVDVTSPLDYIEREAKSKGLTIPDNFLIYDYLPKNQGKTNRCTAYSAAAIKSVIESIEVGEEITINPVTLWNKQLTTSATEENGDYIHSPLKWLVKEPIKATNGKKYHTPEYRRVEKGENYIKRLQKHLWMKKLLATGSLVYKNNGVLNFTEASKTGILPFTGSRAGGHAFHLKGWQTIDGELFFVAVNSWGSSWGKFKNGTFLVRASEVHRLFSCYIVKNSWNV